MTIPTPDQLAKRLATFLSQQTFTDADGQPVRLDATAPGTFEQVLAAALALGDYETYLFLQGRALEFLPSTATVGNGGLLPQHADIWGVPRIGPQAAVGHVVITAGQAVTVVQGATLTVDGSVQWALDAAVTVPAGGSASVAVTCTTTGTGGNLSGNTTLTLVQPVAGVVSVVTDQDGLAGGADIEPVESWRSRIIDKIRTPYNGGTVQDYRSWALAAGAYSVNVVPSYTGAGTVGIVVAMSGPRVPTADEVARVQAYIDERRPVRGNATVYPVELVPQTPVVRLGLDNQTNREAVTASFAAIFNGVGIGGTLYVEALQAALYDTVGARSSVIAPAADIVFQSMEMPIMTGIDWRDGAS
ncbi:baseplate J/gp47 family protein [Bombella apis]|uniref:baseplate J/gp47 family protein n=1 Tax=Bombella apis TaxID=1785988 RepID=UPI0024A80D2A|nr:baseplate J/gp47 family protein [Bombella apis]